MLTDNHICNVSQDIKSMKPEILFQFPPRQRNTFCTVPHRKNWTASMETYQNAAKREYDLLMANHREGNHEIVIGYLKEYGIQDLLNHFSLIKEHLTNDGIIAYQVAEITRDGYGKPVNRIHYHFLIDYHHSKRRLVNAFKEACLYAGLQVGTGKDCMVKYRPIPDSVEFERRCRYILKYKKYQRRAILFRPKTGIDKTGMVNH